MDNQQQGDQPKRQDVIKWYKEQIQMAKLRHELTVLQSETVQAEAMRLEAMAVMAKFKSTSNGEKSPQEQNDGESDGKPELEPEVEV